jgi:hypothetical protein
LSTPAPLLSDVLPAIVRGESRVVSIVMETTAPPSPPTTEEAAATYTLGISSLSGGTDHIRRTFGPAEYSDATKSWTVVITAAETLSLPSTESDFRLGIWRVGLPEPLHLQHLSATEIAGRPQ